MSDVQHSPCSTEVNNIIALPKLTRRSSGSAGCFPLTLRYLPGIAAGPSEKQEITLKFITVNCSRRRKLIQKRELVEDVDYRRQQV